MIEIDRKTDIARLNEIAEYAFNGLQVTAVKAIPTLRPAVDESSLPPSVDSNRAFAARYKFDGSSVPEAMCWGMK